MPEAFDGSFDCPESLSIVNSNSLRKIPHELLPEEYLINDHCAAYFEVAGTHYTVHMIQLKALCRMTSTLCFRRASVSRHMLSLY